MKEKFYNVISVKQWIVLCTLCLVLLAYCVSNYGLLEKLNYTRGIKYDVMCAKA